MLVVALVRGGVILFRGTGTDARRYVEADRSRADDYYLGYDATIARFTALDSEGNVAVGLALDPEAYAAWVDWVRRSALLDRVLAPHLAGFA
ncbi:hypothetical protein [Georgenia yuyongxinii]